MSINPHFPLLEEDSIEMVCLHCGKRTMILDSANTKRVERLCKEVKFFTSSVSTTVYGVCNFCKKEKEMKKNLIDQNGCTC